MSSTAIEMAQWIKALQTNMLLKNKSSIKNTLGACHFDTGRTTGLNNLLNGYALGWPVIIRDEHPAFAPSVGNRSAFYKACKCLR
jgi:hypothetical protein